MKWNNLTKPSQLEEIQEESNLQPVLIFKHSTSCSISKTVLNRIERNWKEEEMTGVKPYYLDLLSYRPISNQIAALFKVEHQSPQVLLLKNGEPFFDCSHFEIDYEHLKKVLKN